MSLRFLPIITEPDQDSYHILSLLYIVMTQTEQDELVVEPEEQETNAGYEGATVFPPIEGLHHSTVVYDYPAIDYNTIWGPRGFASNCSRQHTINNCVKNDCVEHIITDGDNTIQAIYITSKPNIDSKQKISNEKICSICAEDFDIDDNMLDDCCFNKCCSNHFHTSCLNKWILNNFEQNKYPSCPLCRKSIEMNYNLAYNNLYTSPIIRSYDEETDTETETVFETESVVQYFGPSTSTTTTSITNNQQSSNTSLLISNDIMEPTITNLLNILMNSRDIDIYQNQIDRHNFDIYVGDSCVASRIDNRILEQIIYHIQNSNSNINQEQTQNSNEFNFVPVDFEYKLNEETKIYSIYEINSGELKMTLPEGDVNLVIQQSGCSLNQVIKALVEEEGDIVNTIMALTM